MNLSAALFGPRRAAARLIRRADKARDTGDYSEAAKFYSRALDLTPARTDIRVQLGHMLKELGRYQAAEAAYRRALSRSPDDGDIHLHLGHLLKLTGRKKEAIAAYRDAARLLADSTAPAAELSALGVAEMRESSHRKRPAKPISATGIACGTRKTMQERRRPTGLQSRWRRHATTSASNTATC